MQRIFCLTLGLTLSALLSATSLQADPPAGQGKIRVLLTVGGHGFEEKPFYALFDAMPDVRYTKATMPKDAGLLKPGLEKQYDVLVRYDMVGGVKPEQEKALVELLNRGIGLVALHHNLGCAWQLAGVPQDHRRQVDLQALRDRRQALRPVALVGGRDDPRHRGG